MLNAWVKDVDNRGLAGALSNVAAEAPSAKGRMEKWTVSNNEMTACTGWHTLASIARQDNGLPDAYFADYLDTIESKVHTSKNWVKYAMNNALINIGVRNPALEKKATAAAKRIGTVEVDHGETGCKTPDAASYIKKTLAHRKKKASKVRPAKSR
jgi:3-methyladenine DNA glycosylase AlkD